MSLKFITNEAHLENVNGSKKFEEFNINYDSNREKNEEVKASFNNNGKKYYVEDSLQKFVNAMPKIRNSIFDSLNNDLKESKNPYANNFSRLNKIKKFKNVETRATNGITKRLFDYVAPNDNNHITNNYTHKYTHKHKNTHKHKYTHKHKHKYKYNHKLKHDKKHTRRLKLKTK